MLQFETTLLAKQKRKCMFESQQEIILYLFLISMFFAVITMMTQIIVDPLVNKIK